MSVKKVAIVGGSRIPFARSMGEYMGLSNKTLMTASLRSLVEKYDLQNLTGGEVALGAVIKHSSDWNLARESCLGSGLRPEVPAFDLQQACGTSLEACILLSHKISLGKIDWAIAGGTDTNSDLPVVFSQNFSHKMLESFKGRSTFERLKPFVGLGPKDLKPVFPTVIEPRTGLSMGQSCELMAQQWEVPQNEQDQLALTSHNNTAKAIEDGFYDDLVVPFNGLQMDNNIRPNGSLEKMAKLKPAFEKSSKGTLTAANSSPLTDGAASVLLASEDFAKEMGWPVLAYFVDGEVAAVDYVDGKEGLLMAPAYAVPRLLKRNNLELQDFDYYEIHEAFAAQVLCTLKAWESEEFCRNQLGLPQALGSIDRNKMNVKGGSIAIGHPFAATGARIVASLAKILKENSKPGRGLISICTAGGMGVTAIVES